jgi:NADH-quinone oxidoreductase subunit N
VFTGADLSNTEITTAFFESINKYITYTTHLDLTHILGEVFLASFLCFAFVFVAVTAKHLDNNSKRVFAVYINNFAILGLIITSLLFIETLLTVSTANPLFAMSIIVDYYSLFIKLLINASVIFILTSSHYYLISRQNSNPEFSLIILLATLFLLVLVSAFNLFTAFMCIIGFSITLYVLVLSDLVEHTKREATIKYYYLSVYSSGFLIFGIFLLYLVSNSLNYINIKVFLNNLILAVNYQSMDILNTQVILIIIMIALISQLIGILFKLSAFPCHF